MQEVTVSNTHAFTQALRSAELKAEELAATLAQQQKALTQAEARATQLRNQNVAQVGAGIPSNYLPLHSPHGLVAWMQFVHWALNNPF